MSNETMTDPLSQPISLDLTAGEVNQLLFSLGQRPYVEVAALINKVKSQGDAQFVPPPPAELVTEVAN